MTSSGTRASGRQNSELAEISGDSLDLQGSPREAPARLPENARPGEHVLIADEILLAPCCRIFVAVRSYACESAIFMFDTNVSGGAVGGCLGVSGGCEAAVRGLSEGCGRAVGESVCFLRGLFRVGVMSAAP